MRRVFNVEIQSSKEISLILGPGIPQLKGRASCAENQTLDGWVLYLSHRPCDNAVRLNLQALQKKKTAWITLVQQPGTASTTVKKLLGNRNRKQFSRVPPVPPQAEFDTDTADKAQAQHSGCPSQHPKQEMSSWKLEFFIIAAKPSVISNNG